MTSTTGTNAHPEVAEISALAEGLLPPARSADVRDHLGHCTLCADVLTSLDEIRALLGVLPGPARMPADVAGRIDAALAAEALLDSTASDVPRGTDSTTDVPRGTPPAIPTPGPAVPRGTDRPNGRASGSTGPGRTGGGRRRVRLLWATVTAAAVFGLGGVLIQSLLGNLTENAADVGVKKATAGVPAGAEVRSQVRSLLARTNSGGSETGPRLSPEKTDRAPLGSGPAATVPACVLDGTHRPEPPIAAAPQNYRGTASYLVVLPHPGDPSTVDAFVVDSACTRGTPGQVLFQDTYPR